MDNGLPRDLSPIQKEIIKLVLSMQEKRKSFTKNLILKECKANLKYNEDEITSNLEILYQKSILVEGMQLIRPSILENANRNLIYLAINENPGIRLRELARLLNLTLPTCSWHIVILKEFKFIKILKFKNQFCFGHVNIADEFLIIHHILRNKLNRQIISELLQGTDLTIPVLSEKFGINRSTVQYHIKLLENLAIIEKIREGHSEFLKIRNKNRMNSLLNSSPLIF